MLATLQGASLGYAVGAAIGPGIAQGLSQGGGGPPGLPSGANITNQAPGGDNIPIPQGGAIQKVQTATDRIIDNLIGIQTVYAAAEKGYRLISRFTPSRSPKLEIGYQDVAYFPPMGHFGKIRHTAIRISGTGEYDGTWGFHVSSRAYLPDALRGFTVPGKVFSDNGPLYDALLVSQDIEFIKQVYNNIQRSAARTDLKYNLYGFSGKCDSKNCYGWRDAISRRTE